MNQYKKFVYVFLVFNILFLLSNFIIWTFFTKNILVNDKINGHAGDLARIGYLATVKNIKKDSIDLPVRHKEFKEINNQKIDVLTIGDSFSNGVAGGLNPYYQDYIASINKFNVVNIQPYKGKNFIQTISILLNSGYLDQIKPKYIIIESVERLAILNLATQVDYNLKENSDNLGNFYKNFVYKNEIPNPGFINNGNFKFLYCNILRIFSDNAFITESYLRKLKIPLFTGKNGDAILFHSEEINYIDQATDNNIESLNNNLNELAKRLKSKGIKLYFMPAVDKYNLYNEYILKNPYPQSTFFEKLRMCEKNYYFIDTKSLLSKKIKEGEKDIFYQDDTHWSWKASKIIFEEVKFQ